MIITKKSNRKRFLSAATALSIGVTLCTGPLLGLSAAEGVRFTSESMQADAGEQIEVKLLAEGNTGMTAYGVNISYDAGCFAPVSVENHWKTGSMQDSISTSADGSFSVYWYANDNYKKDGEALTIVFDVLPTAAAGDYTITYSADQASTFAIVENDIVSVKTEWSDTVVQVTGGNPSDGTNTEEKTDMPVLRADAVHTKKKQTTTIPVLIEQPSLLKGISLEMQFDPDAVEKDSVEIALGGELQNANQSFSVNYETGLIRYSMYTDPIANDCVLLELTLVPLKAFEIKTDYIPQSTYNQDYELIAVECVPITVDLNAPETQPTTEATTTTSKATTTTSKATTTTSKATTTTSKATTTTSKATTTTSKATTTTSKATTTTSKVTTTTAKATTTTAKTTTTTSKVTTTTSKATTTTTKVTTTTSKATTTTSKATTTTSKATTTTSKETTTTSKETTTTSKATTTTSKETTTTSVETTTTIEATTTTESTTNVIGYRYSAETKTAFFYAHDENAFAAEELIDSVTRYAIYSNGLIETVGEAVTEGIEISFGEQTPEKLWNSSDEGDYRYTPDIVITDQFGEYRIKNGATVYIGVKGDVNLDGSVNSIDAAQILTYAAELGAGGDACLSAEQELEDFVYFLADIDGESRTQDPLSPVNAVDAASILTYAALIGSGEKITWEEFLSQ